MARFIASMPEEGNTPQRQEKDSLNRANRPLHHALLPGMPRPAGHHRNAVVAGAVPEVPVENKVLPAGTVHPRLEVVHPMPLRRAAEILEGPAMRHAPAQVSTFPSPNRRCGWISLKQLCELLSSDLNLPHSYSPSPNSSPIDGNAGSGSKDAMAWSRNLRSSPE